MKQQAELVSWALNLILKSVIMSAKWAAVTRLRMVQRCLNSVSEELLKENVLLRQKVVELEGLVSILRSQLSAKATRRHLSVKERLLVLWHMESFGIPRRRAKEYYGIACSTIYRWVAKIDRADVGGDEPANKTPADIVKLVWKIATANPAFGKLRIAQQLALLDIFLSASTFRNILSRPRPLDTDLKPETLVTQPETSSPKHIRADHPNHVWSADLTTVRTWLFSHTHVLAAIDHFSRKLVALVPLKRPDTASVIAALESAFELHGCPRHFVTDQGRVFTAPAFTAFLVKRDAKHRTGAVGKHASVSITERVIETLKYEWLRRVPLIRGFDHLTELCLSFSIWYNQWRPHQGIAGARPDDVYHSSSLSPPLAAIIRPRLKTGPPNIESIHFADTRTTAWRLPRVA